MKGIVVKKSSFPLFNSNTYEIQLIGEKDAIEIKIPKRIIELNKGDTVEFELKKVKGE